MANDQPDSLDRIIGQSRAQTGSVPAELSDPSNYLIFDRPKSAGAAKDAASFVTLGKN